LESKENWFKVKVKELKLKEKKIEGQVKELESKLNKICGQVKEPELKAKQYEALKNNIDEENKSRDNNMMKLSDSAVYITSTTIIN
jgi:uncharacterized protein (DUF3084 family)